MPSTFDLTHEGKAVAHTGLLTSAMCQDLAAHFGLDVDVTRHLLAQHAAAGNASTLAGWKMAADMLASAGMAAAPYQPVVH
jgi:hypothetical protein